MKAEDVEKIKELKNNLKELLKKFSEENRDNLLVKHIFIDAELTEIEVCNTDFLEVPGAEVSHIITFQTDWS